MARSRSLLLLAILPSIGCEGETDTGEEARAGSALCPNGNFIDQGNLGRNPCAQCAGLACYPEDKCSRSQAQSSVTCECHAGHMVCCSSGQPSAFSGPQCDYGSFPPPPCPAVRPSHGDVCEVPQVCAYPRPCCSTPAVVHCDTRGDVGGWVVDDSCLVPVRCPDGGLDARSDSNAIDAADGG
jgi:hypothetical protein